MKYKTYCLTCSKWNEIEWLVVSPICPGHELDHTVLPNSVVLIQNADDCGKGGTQLYRTLRRKLIVHVAQYGQYMSQDHIKQAAEHFAVPQEIRDLFFTTDEQIALGEIFNKRAIQDRQIRNNRVVSELMNHLTYLQTVDIVNDLGDLSDKYINFGVEGVSEGDPVGIFDYFESTAGTQFETAGFLQKQFTPSYGITMLQLSQRVMNILRITI